MTVKKLNLKFVLLMLVMMFILGACSDSKNDEPQQTETGIFNNLKKYPVDGINNIGEAVTITDIRLIVAKMANSELMGKKTKSCARDYTISTINDERGDPNIYVINFANNSGFILISGNKNYVPVLAYSPTGNYVIGDEKNGGVKIWEKETIEAIKMVCTLPSDSVVKFRNMWFYYETTENPENCIIPSVQRELRDFDVESAWAAQVLAWNAAGYDVIPITQSEITGNTTIDNRFRYSAQQSIYPLYEDEWEHLSAVVRHSVSNINYKNNFIQTIWQQKNHYNDSCPIINGEHAAVGCGPLAVGQVMRYYEYPTSFNWNNMPYNYPTPTTAQFLHIVGLQCNAQYGSETSISLKNAKNALQYYGFNASTANHDYTRTINNLQLNRPVIMRGDLTKPDGSISGHQWIASGFNNSYYYTVYDVYTFNNQTTIDVVDTYDTDFIHVNYIYMVWGWNSQVNGFYYDNSVSVSGYFTSMNNRSDIYDIYPNN